MITTTWQCNVTETCWQVIWSLTPGDPATPPPPNPRRRRTLRHREGSQKLNSRKLRTAGKVCRYKGLVGKCLNFHVKLQPKHRLCTLLSVCMPSWRQSLGTQYEVQFHQQNQQNACHCHVDSERGHFLFGHVCKKKQESTRGSRVPPSGGKKRIRP